MVWEVAPQRTPDEDGLELLRKLGYELSLPFLAFHEVAIDDPFEAERWVQRIGDILIGVVGYPTGMQWGHLEDVE